MFLYVFMYVFWYIYNIYTCMYLVLYMYLYIYVHKHTSPGVQTHTFSPKNCIQEASYFDANHTKGGRNGSDPNYSLQVYKL